ncbi:hypothetical protein TRFO_17976 [Tritrichomonas foetus]|uniref:Importin subunit beta-1/Transportin-1-like TPR repeats domain-containing protein n=1 Tax=Tritrichomonas foetus TaxID=1144522 RepID=A0A1J4KM36_9EUKA|nr:hypothetical protein TRFO_17976 [Tritrichomonas foetus]|eukprot:OHT12283.1 hypothetical protein TRFO_17976 [Tritrichomonas foetus]
MSKPLLIQSMNIDQELQGQLANALELLNNPSISPEQRASIFQFSYTFRKNDPLKFIIYLIIHLANPNTSELSRAVAAIWLYESLHKRTPDAQRHFVVQWFKVDLNIRDQLRLSATEGLTHSSTDSLKFQCANLLGLFYAIEFYTSCTRESINPVFNTSFSELIDIAMNSDPGTRILLYGLFQNFAMNSLELNPNCAHDQPFLLYAPRLYDVYLAGMMSGVLELQGKALEAFTSSFLIFKRHFSFLKNRTDLLEVVFQIILSNIPPLCTPAYQLLRKCIDCCYPDMSAHMEQIKQITLIDMKSGNEFRQIEACFLWSTIGDVESDIQNTNKNLVKLKHRDFTATEFHSKWAFTQLFESLVMLICNTDISETQASIHLEFTPAHAAFSCLSSLTKATDDFSLPLIFKFVQDHAQAEDWRLRYASALLLNAASQVPSFNNVKNILIAYEFFVTAIVDAVPRISEVAMWSLGRLVNEIPELVVDQVRFGRLCENVAQKMDVSDELTSRACWLLNVCFNVFCLDDTNSPLVQNFEKFSILLMQAADKYDVNAQDAAFGALNRLIERTPSTIADQYNQLFNMVTAKLSVLISADDTVRNNPKYTQQMIGLLSLVQAIVMNVGEMIRNVSDQLMSMLIVALDFQNGTFVCEVLPAMGAVARAIQEDFGKYMPSLLEKVFEYLSKAEFVQPAAVFVADIFNSFPSFPDELTDRFVKALFNTLNFDDITTQAIIASFSALAEIAKMIREKCLPWIETYLELLESESRSMLSSEDENLDQDNAQSFAIENLQIYQTLVPILSPIPKGDRKVRNFFHIFEKIVKLQNRLDESVYPDAVILIRMIAETYQRRMNVYLNKPAVIEILKKASESVDAQLAQLAKDTLDIVRRF